MDNGGEVDIFRAAAHAGKVLLGSEVQSVILGEIGAANTVRELQVCFSRLHALTDSQLCSIMCTKECIAMIKSNVVNESNELRYFFVEAIGSLIIRCWVCLHDHIELEGFVAVESRLDARRMREDFIDMSIDIFKNFASGCIGKAPSSDPARLIDDDVLGMRSYCRVLSMLLDCYNASFEPLNAWVDALLGVSGSGSRGILSASRLTWREQSLSLVPLMRPCLNVAFSDPYLLVARARVLPTYQNSAVPLVTGFVKMLLNQTRPDSSPLVVLDLSSTKGYQQMFATGKGLDPTADSRSGDSPLPVVQYASQWVMTTLRYVLLETPHLGELRTAVKDIIILTQHSLMADCRYKLTLPLLHRLFFLLEGGQVTDPAAHDELVCLALLLLRYVHDAVPGAGEPLALTTAEGNPSPCAVYPFAMRLLKIMFRINDSVVQTRLFAELSALLLDVSVDPAETATSERFDFSKQAIALLMKESATMDSKLLVALLRVVDRSIHITAQVLLEHAVASGEAAASSSTGSGDVVLDTPLSSPAKKVPEQRADHTWAIFDHQLFVSKNRLYRHYVRAAGASTPPGEGETWVSEAAEQLREHLVRLLKGGMYLVKLCAVIYVKKPAQGVAGDCAAVSFVRLMDTLSSVLLVSGDAGSGSALLKRHLIANQYQQAVRKMAHELSTAFDHTVEALLKISTTPLFSQLCLEPHLLLLNGLLVRRLPVVTSILGSAEFAQVLLSYLKVVLRQPEARRTHAIAGVKEAMDEGFPASNKDVDLTGGASDPLCAALVLHTLDLIVEVARGMGESPETAAACLALLKGTRTEITRNLKDDAVIRTGAVLERVERSIREVSALLPKNRRPAEDGEEHEARRLMRQTVDQCEARLDFEAILHCAVSRMYEESSAPVLSAPKEAGASAVVAESSLLDFSGDVSGSKQGAPGSQWSGGLDLVCDSAFGDQVTDHSREIGAFSRDIPAQGVESSYGPRAYESSADVFALVDDVINAHLYSDEETATEVTPDSLAVGRRRCSTNQWALASVAPGERAWTQVSGSSDVLTVLVSTDFRPLSSTAQVSVRVHNSSGFKIPYFTLHLLLQSAQAEVDLTTLPSGGLSAVFDGSALYQATGAEYFLPDAYLERVFSFPVQRFAPLDVVVRVAYPDLNGDDEDLFEVPTEGPAKSTPRGRRAKVAPAMAAGYFNGYGGADGPSARHTALVQCSPVRLPVAAMLLPYGGGALSALSYWRQMQHAASGGSESKRAGVPLPVFQCMWSRLRGRKADFRVTVQGRPVKSGLDLFPEDSILQLVSSAIVESINRNGNGGSFALGMDCKVQTRRSHGHALQGLVGASSAGGDAEPFVAWSLQTVWGAEVACKLVVLPSDSGALTHGANGKTVDPFAAVTTAVSSFAGPDLRTWRAVLEVRCSDRQTCTAVLADVDGFVQSIGGGSFRLTSN